MARGRAHPARPSPRRRINRSERGEVRDRGSAEQGRRRRCFPPAVRDRRARAASRSNLAPLAAESASPHSWAPAPGAGLARALRLVGITVAQQVRTRIDFRRAKRSDRFVLAPPLGYGWVDHSQPERARPIRADVLRDDKPPPSGRRSPPPSSPGYPLCGLTLEKGWLLRQLARPRPGERRTGAISERRCMSWPTR